MSFSTFRIVYVAEVSDYPEMRVRSAECFELTVTQYCTTTEQSLEQTCRSTASYSRDWKPIKS